jgi:hypothetical protein
MRKLNDLETTSIKTRLDLLQIAYIEIYDELLDHYISQLEKTHPSEFNQNLEQLNETFAWSVVKKMETNLEKNTQKRVASMQWESLKFWNYSFNEVLISILLTASMLGFYLSSGIEGLFLASSILAVIGILIAIKKQGKGINFSLYPKNQKPVACVSKAILSRLGLLYGCLSWFWVGVSNWGKTDLGPIGNTLGIIVCTGVFLYTISLLKVSIIYKKPEIILPSV